jgi:hypothetical protein
LSSSVSSLSASVISLSRDVATLRDKLDGVAVCNTTSDY